MSKKDFSNIVGSGETSIGNGNSPNAVMLREAENLTPELSLLTEEEQTALLNYESVIEKGLQTFFEVGQALMMIRDSKLYRQNHISFEDYCLHRWGFQRRKAYRLMEAAEVLKNVSNSTQIVFLPQNERQARELAQLPPDEQQTVWEEIIEESSASGKTPTAKLVTQKVKERLGILSTPIKPITAPLSSKVVDVKLTFKKNHFILLTEAAEQKKMTLEQYLVDLALESIQVIL